jgi:hypothetical protein
MTKRPRTTEARKLVAVAARDLSAQLLTLANRLSSDATLDEISDTYGEPTPYEEVERGIKVYETALAYMNAVDMNEP